MATGKVKRPAYETGDSKLTLTATLSRGQVSKTKVYSASVRQQGMTDTQMVAADKLHLEFPVDPKYIVSDIELPLNGRYGSAITWESSKPEVLSADGTVVRPTNGSPLENGTVTMTATLVKGEITDTKEFACQVIAWTDDEEVLLDAEEITWDLIKGGNFSITEVTSDLELPTEGSRGSTISWVTNSTGIVDISGEVTRPTYIQGDVVAALSATLVKGVASASKNITGIRVTKMPITNKEAVDKALKNLSNDKILGENTSLSDVQVDFMLPVVSDLQDCSSVKLAWSMVDKQGTVVSSHPNIVIVDRETYYEVKVKRPNISENNGEVSLKCIASSSVLTGSEATGYKTFDIVITKLENK